MASSRSKSRDAAIRRALETVMRAYGLSHTRHDKHVAADALGVLAGERAFGTLRLDDVEIEISITVRQAASSPHETRNYREQAISLLVRQGWRDHCCASVADRSPWRSYKSKTKGCSRPVTTALVNVLPDKLSFAYACNQHARTEYVGALILELSPGDLKAARAARAELGKLADEAYKRGERWSEDRPEFDAAIERLWRNR